MSWSRRKLHETTASADAPYKIRNLTDFLAEEFAELRAGGVQIDPTSAAEAAFLGISAGYLSRIRNGKAPLAEELAHKIANALSRNDDARRRTLLRELLDARELAQVAQVPQHEPDEEDISPHAIIDFFDRLAAPNSLVCVDYRDLPQATRGGPFPKTADEAAYAVAHGLCFAMFQPFGPVEDLRKRLIDLLQHAPEQRQLPPCLRLHEYVLELAARVRRVYQEMRENIEKYDKCLGQLVLYEAATSPPTLVGCGVQSRVFYADYELDRRHYTDVYEWIAGPKQHYFIRRGTDSLNTEAVRQQFHPITTHWTEVKRLPENNQKLAKVYRDFGEHAQSDSDAQPRWRVWTPDEDS